MIIFFCPKNPLKVIFEKEVKETDIEKHIRERERLNQALSGKLSEIQKEMKQLFQKYAIEALPGLTHDVSCYVIEELYLERFNLPEY